MSLLSRDALLAHVGKLAEEVVELPGIGSVICRELTGTQRARVLQVLTPALQAGGSADLGRYQEMLLQLGLADPDSPVEARQPLLDLAGAKSAMELGAGKVELLCGAIERLSGLDKGASERAEGNSAATLSSTATSE